MNNGSVGSLRFDLALNDVPQGVTIVSGSSPEGGGESPPPEGGLPPLLPPPPDGAGEGYDEDGGGDPPFDSPNLPQDDGGILFIASLYDLA